MKKRSIEEVIIFLVIAIKLLEFSSIRSFSAGDIKFMVKLVSWFALGYFFYSFSIMKILFGKERDEKVSTHSPLKCRHVDLLILFSYYLFMFGDFIFFIASGEDMLLFGGLSRFLKTGSHDVMLQFLLFPVGGVLLLWLSIMIGATSSFGEDSFMGIINETGKAKGIVTKAYRSLITFLLLEGFFIILFSLLSEWFSLALDEPLAIAGAVVLLYTFRNKKLKHVRQMKIGEQVFAFISSLDKMLVEAFRDKKKVWLVFAGMISLTVVTDFFLIILPVFLGVKESPYIHLEDGMSIIEATGLLFEGKIAFFAGYVSNFVALALIAIGGFYIWYMFFLNKRPHISSHALPLLVFSSIMLFSKPLFIIGGFRESEIIGVSAMFSIDKDYMLGIWVVIGIAALAAALSYLFRRKVGEPAVKGIYVIFITFYLITFLTSVVSFYTAESILDCSTQRSRSCLYSATFNFLQDLGIYSPLTIYAIDFIQVASKLLEISFFLITVSFHVIGYIVVLNLLRREKIEQR